MMQQLLRGRLLYILLATLTLLLYARTISGGYALPPEEELPVPAAAAGAEWTLERWDAHALQRAVQQKPHLAMWLSLGSAVAGGLGLGGLFLTVQGLWTGRLRSFWRIPAAPLPAWTFGELGRIILLILVIAGLMPFVRLALLSWKPTWELDHRLWMTLAMLLLDSFAAMAILTFAQGKRGSVWNAAGAPGRQAPRWISLGLRSYVTAFPWLFLLLFAVVEIARVFNVQPPVEPIHELLFREHRPAVFAMTLLLACAIGPLAEELFFRGVIYTAIRRKTSRWPAMLISGGVFAGIHTNLIGFLPITLLGCLLAYLYERTGSLVAPLAVHMFHNTLLMAFAMLYRQLSL